MVASLVAASSRNNYVFAKISELTTGNEKTSHLDPTKNYFVPFRSSSLFRNSNAQWGGGEKRVAFSKASNESIAR